MNQFDTFEPLIQREPVDLPAVLDAMRQHVPEGRGALRRFCRSLEGLETFMTSVDVEYQDVRDRTGRIVARVELGRTVTEVPIDEHPHGEQIRLLQSLTEDQIRQIEEYEIDIT